MSAAVLGDTVRRIWARDASLWKSDESHRKIIDNALGWLPVVSEMRKNVPAILEIVDDVRANFSDVVVLGMGGSSLCPEVFRRSIGSAPGYPRLHVLDSTVPAAVRALDARIDPKKTLFIVASKSGSTTEPRMFYRYYRGRVDDGKNFLAITDPSTQLEREAREDGFRRIVLNPADIGGRYSALSNFGIVPAALAGVDITTLLDRAGIAAESSKAEDADHNWAAQLGEAIGKHALEGRDKLTLVTSPPIDSLGLWIEQLIAESTGKEGKGILPVAGEALGGPEHYGDDRLFVWIHIDDASQTRAKLDALRAAGHPVIERTLHDPLDLGAEFFEWEFATAVAGTYLGINPFDQPNVQESKDNTRALLDQYVREGRFDEPAAGTVDDVPSHLRKVKSHDYVAITQYIEETPEHDRLLSEIQKKISHSLRVATTTGYGPRFLHSTGQLHKGGSDAGVFIQLVASEGPDVPIPGEPYGFRVLANAQSAGDFQSLVSRNRRALRVNLGADATAGLQSLLARL